MEAKVDCGTGSAELTLKGIEQLAQDQELTADTTAVLIGLAGAGGEDAQAVEAKAGSGKAKAAKAGKPRKKKGKAGTKEKKKGGKSPK